MAFDFRRIWWKNKEKHMLNHLAIVANTFYIIYYELICGLDKDNNKITELRTILQRESRNS